MAALAHGRTMVADQNGRSVARSTRNLTEVEITIHTRWLIRYYTCPVSRMVGVTAESAAECNHRQVNDFLGKHWNPFDDDVDFEGGDIDDVYITVDALPSVQMRLIDFIEQYKCSVRGNGNYMTSSIKYFNHNLVEKRGDFYQFEGKELMKANSMRLTFDVFGRFDPSKLRFDVRQVWTGIRQRTNYLLTGCVSYDNAPPSNEGDDYWEWAFGYGVSNWFTKLEGTADWQFAAAEAIVRWCKCVLAKRRCAELRRAEKKRHREKASRDKFEAAAEKRCKKFKATKLGQTLW